MSGEGFDYTAMAEEVAAEVGFAVFTVQADDALEPVRIGAPGRRPDHAVRAAGPSRAGRSARSMDLLLVGHDL